MPIVSHLPGHRGYPSADVMAVHAAAEALQVREIKLFRIAYARWFGEEASEPAIEAPFMRYLFAAQAPVWVRHFAREVLDRLDTGELDPVDYGLPPRLSPPAGIAQAEGAFRALLVVAWVAIVGIVFVGFL